MASADWKKCYERTLPEDYGWYLVKTKSGEVTIAKFDHPIGHRQTGWYVQTCVSCGTYEELDNVVAWDFLPE